MWFSNPIHVGLQTELGQATGIRQAFVLRPLHQAVTGWLSEIQKDPPGLVTENQVVSGWQVESMTGTGLTDQEMNNDLVSWACLALTDLRIGEIGY